ncbi:MAG: hypothetical protein NTV22_02605 [bacterium]|nr:hypothetical protein [bacterium]
MLVFTWLVLLVPWQGKKLFPVIFGTPYVQYSSVVVSAIFVSIGMFFSMRAFFCRAEEKRQTGLTCLGFVTLFALVIGLYGVAMPNIIRMCNSLENISSIDALTTLIQKLHEPGSEAKRPNIARAIYVMYGVASPYETTDGSYTVYKPTSKDEESWIQSHKNQTKIKHYKEYFDGLSKQLICFTSLYIGCFFTTFFIGTLTLIYKKRDETSPANLS